MDLLAIKMNNQKCIYLDSVHLENKEYVAYMDEENVYVSECVKDGELFFKDVSDDVYKKVIEVLDI